MSAILRQLCPRCRRGKMFRYSILRGFPRMHDRCPVCNPQFAREQGYFLGAMYISYCLALVAIGVIAVVLWAVTRGSMAKIVIWATFLFLPLAPPLSLFARVLWVYFDQAVDPERPPS